MEAKLTLGPVYARKLFEGDCGNDSVNGLINSEHF